MPSVPQFFNAWLRSPKHVMLGAMVEGECVTSQISCMDIDLEKMQCYVLGTVRCLSFNAQRLLSRLLLSTGHQSPCWCYPLCSSYSFDAGRRLLRVFVELVFGTTRWSMSSVLTRSGVASSRLVMPHSRMDVSSSSLRTIILLVNAHLLRLPGTYSVTDAQRRPVRRRESTGTACQHPQPSHRGQ